MQRMQPNALSFTHLAEKQQIQSIQDNLAECLNIALAITDSIGNFVTQPSGHPPECWVTSRTAHRCIVVKTVMETGLLGPSEESVFIICAGVGHILVPLRIGGSVSAVMVATEPLNSGFKRLPQATDCVPKLVSPEAISLGRLSREQIVAAGKLLSSVASRLVELEAKHRLADQRIRDLAAMNESAAIVNSTLDPHLLYDMMVKKAAELVNAESAFLMMPDSKEDGLRIIASVGVSESGGRRLTTGIGKNLIRRVFESGEPVQQNDLPAQLLVGERERPRHSRRGSLIVVPLKANGEVIGVLGAGNCDRVFESGKSEILQGFANQATFAISNSRLFQETQQALQKLNRMFELTAEINSVRSLDDVLKEVNRNALEATQGTACNITLIDDDGRVRVRATVGFSTRVNKHIVVRSNGLSVQTKHSGQPLVIPDTLSAADRVNPVMIQAGVRASLCLPLRTKDKVIGVMWVHYAQPRTFPQSDINLLLGFANQAAVAIENAQLREALVEQATRDGKTGLFNHDYLIARLRIEMEKSKRVGLPLSLIMMDIDNFKEFNDTFGHMAGDEALRMIALTVSSKTRGSDTVARYGGEEFAVLLPNADAERALIIAERIRVSIGAASQKAHRASSHFQLTVSLGVASFPQFATTENELIERADRALYQSKARGKNMASIFSP